MKNFILVVVILLVGGGAGFLLGQTHGPENGRSQGVRGDAARIQELVQLKVTQDDELARLRAEIDRLRGLLAQRPDPAQAENPYPDDTPEAVEQLLQDAYAENNVDWLLDAIERLLRMGDRGYPLLKRLLDDLIWRRRFLPSESDFRVDQLYRFARVFANLEPQFIGFLNYLLKDPSAHPWYKQAAMMGGAFYVGSKAKGSEELKQTMLQLFLQDAGSGVFGVPGLPQQITKRMNVVAMAMSGDPQMIAPLRAELGRTKDEGAKSDIIGALAYLGDPGAVPLIEERLNPAEGDWRKEIRALGRVGTEQAHETATRFLKSIPDSGRFYRHARDYVRAGGGTAAVLLIKERFEAHPEDKEVNAAIGTLRRFPTRESLETLNSISTLSPDKKVQKRASEAADEIGRRMRGEIPGMPGGVSPR